MKNKKMICSLVVLSSLMVLSACGKDKDSSTAAVASGVSAETAQADDKGTYKAILKPMNEKIALNAKGNAIITLKNDEFYIQMDMAGTTAAIAHAQYVHATDACPSAINDTNKDGIIDSVEASKSYGMGLITLSDLKTHALVSNAFPVADSHGNYAYREWQAMKDLLKELRNHDTSTGMVKLGSKETLNLVKRTVVVYGVAETTPLPTTVVAAKGMTKQASLPIACGTIVKISGNVGKF